MPHWYLVIEGWLDLLYLYFGAVFSYWWAYMTAGPLILDETLKWLSPRFRKWFHSKVSGTVRRGAEVALMLIGVFLAGFLAFKAEHEKRETATADLKRVNTAVATAEERLKTGPPDQRGLVKKLQGDIAQLQTEKATWEASDKELREQLATANGLLELNAKGRPVASWRPSEAQKQKLGELLDKGQEKFPVPVYCQISDAQAKIIASDLWQIFELHNWQAYIACTDLSKVIGINILVRDKDKLSEAPAAAHVISSLFDAAGIPHKFVSYETLDSKSYAVFVGSQR